MKTSNKIPISVLCARLQAIEHYANPQRAFNELLLAWRVHAHKSWYTGAEGWLSVNDAKSLSEYAGYDLLRK